MTNCETNGGSSYTTYFYGVNAQGDVEKIFRMVLNSDTGLYEEKIYGLYTYDAWGSVTATTAAGNAPATTTLVYRNPIRYRGYVYDNETGFYYLQSRYYDPANHRFINADSYGSTGQGFIGYNMFAYCGNNPVILLDTEGTRESLAQTRARNDATLATILLFGAAVICFSAHKAQTKTLSKQQRSSIKDEPIHSVYVLIDKQGEIQYVGRTVNVKAREEAHKRTKSKKNLNMVVLFSGLNYYQARGLEQIFMIEAHTHKDFGGLNLINGISPNNTNASVYIYRGIAYLENQVSNEVLNWLETIGG